MLRQIRLSFTSLLLPKANLLFGMFRVSFDRCWLVAQPQRLSTLLAHDGQTKIPFKVELTNPPLELGQFLPSCLASSG